MTQNHHHLLTTGRREKKNKNKPVPKLIVVCLSQKKEKQRCSNPLAFSLCLPPLTCFLTCNQLVSLLPLISKNSSLVPGENSARNPAKSSGKAKNCRHVFSARSGFNNIHALITKHFDQSPSIVLCPVIIFSLLWNLRSFLVHLQ